jgi:D-arginine dehydrogenase
VNAAGAWADQVADLASVPRQGLICCRRTLIAVDGPPNESLRRWPLVSDVTETLYFKPEAGRLLISPADRTVLQPQDVQADELDVAVAVDRFETMTNWAIKKVTHRWAGFRTLTPDEEPVVGFDTVVPSFLWAAGFGGFGIQAAFAAGSCCEALLTNGSLPPELAMHGVSLERLSPGRSRHAPPSSLPDDDRQRFLKKNAAHEGGE